MNKKWKVLLICVTIVFTLSTVTAYATTPKIAYGYEWSVPNTIYWYTEALNEREMYSLVGAFNKWNQVLASNGSYLLRSFTTGDPPPVYSSLFYDVTLRSTALATFSVSYGNDGKVESANIMLSPYASFSTGAESGKHDLQSIIMHELGHVYGVAHCHELGQTCYDSGCPNNVMSRSLATNTLRRVLKDYDIDSYRAVYE